jgi:hypothetical protein
MAKGYQVGDLAQRPDIPFEVGLLISLEPEPLIGSLAETDGRHSALEDFRPTNRKGRLAGKFAEPVNRLSGLFLAASRTAKSSKFRYFLFWSSGWFKSSVLLPVCLIPASTTTGMFFKA